MQLSERSQGQTLIMSVEGRVDSQTAPDFEARLLGAIAQGNQRIVLNLEAMDYISSAGLRVLLKAARETKALSRELVVCCLRDYIREVFDLSGFTTILKVAPTESDALD